MMSQPDPIVRCEHHGPHHDGVHTLRVSCVWPYLAATEESHAV